MQIQVLKRVQVYMCSHTLVLASSDILGPMWSDWVVVVSKPC